VVDQARGISQRRLAELGDVLTGLLTALGEEQAGVGSVAEGPALGLWEIGLADR
jgi:hypothetical protein